MSHLKEFTLFAYTNTDHQINDIWTNLPDHVGYFVTDRLGGVSREPYEFFNTAMHVGDCVDDVLINRRELARSQGMHLQRLVFASQVHGSDIKQVGEGDLNYDLYTVMRECDGLITTAKEMAIIIQVADCVPILFYDENNEVIGALHAGWRGVVQGILPKAMKNLQEQGTFDVNKFQVFIGPSIGPCCYEVKGEVVDAVNTSIPASETCLEHRDGKIFLDLKKALLNQLTQLGVPTSNVVIAEECTCCYPQRFFSYRKEPETGRFCAGIYFKRKL